MAKPSHFNQAALALSEQVAWIDEHGHTEAGYVLRYGSKDTPGHYGDGGEAIYAADKAELDRLEAIYRSLIPRGWRDKENA